MQDSKIRHIHLVSGLFALIGSTHLTRTEQRPRLLRPAFSSKLTRPSAQLRLQTTLPPGSQHRTAPCPQGQAKCDTGAMRFHTKSGITTTRTLSNFLTHTKSKRVGTSTSSKELMLRTAVGVP